jgi:hypothetical protein
MCAGRTPMPLSAYQAADCPIDLSARHLPYRDRPIGRTKLSRHDHFIPLVRSECRREHGLHHSFGGNLLTFRLLAEDAASSQ